MSNIEHKILGDMQEKDIDGPFQSTTITHHDGRKRKLLYTNIETIFPQNKKIISLTDADGYLTNVNTTFIEMSAYSKQELLGAPHYILRHPDMPKAAFAGLWDSLEKTGKWEGYVKNLRKDGGFYWVFASVFSIFRHGKLAGYTSTRSPAPLEKIQACTKLYKELLDKEKGR